ncbi:hypothetical protein PFISCL1PPCAC_28164, partial [Pristionchus fissidentatus]
HSNPAVIPSASPSTMPQPKPIGIQSTVPKIVVSKAVVPEPNHIATQPTKPDPKVVPTPSTVPDLQPAAPTTIHRRIGSTYAMTPKVPIPAPGLAIPKLAEPPRKRSRTDDEDTGGGNRLEETTKSADSSLKFSRIVECAVEMLKNRGGGDQLGVRDRGESIQQPMAVVPPYTPANYHNGNAPLAPPVDTIWPGSPRVPQSTPGSTPIGSHPSDFGAAFAASSGQRPLPFGAPAAMAPPAPPMMPMYPPAFPGPPALAPNGFPLPNNFIMPPPPPFPFPVPPVPFGPWGSAPRPPF